MGAYINPENQSKREWLEENGEEIRQKEAKKMSENLDSDNTTEMAVCLVDNGPFYAAAICFSYQEFEAFTRPGDSRPRTWYRAEIEDLKEVSDELEMYMKTNERSR